MLGDHTWQYVDGNPTHTNKKDLLVVKSGDSTNILYRVDSWYELADCTTNGLPVEARKLAENTFIIELTNITKTVTVIANDKADHRLLDRWNLPEDDPYRPAILDWLLRRWPDKGPDDIALAEHWHPTRGRMGLLDLKAMYWLDIPPVEGHDEGGERINDWRLLFFNGETKYIPVQEDGVTYLNAIIPITMLITNKMSNPPLFHPPYTIQGLQPGSSSSNDWGIAKWSNATFKVTGSPNVAGEYKPVKWFVFNENSFNPDGTAYIEVPDQSNPQTPGYNWGWSYLHSFFYKTALDERPSGLYSTELLRADHTNCYNTIVSP